MKYFKISILLTVILSIVIFSCDKVDPPYLAEQPEPPDTAACPIPDFPDISNYERIILLEEFTGHTCQNCPEGTLLAHELKEEYGEKLILVSIHAGGFAVPKPDDPGYEIDLRTETGDLLLEEFSASFFPSAMFNRSKINNLWALPTMWWEGVLDTMMTVGPTIGMQMITDFDDSDRKLCIHIKSKYLQDLSNTLMLSVYILEDSIQSAQKNDNPNIGYPTPDIIDYWHNHVLRGPVNNPWGSLVPGSPYLKDSTLITTFKYFLNDDWKAKHCNVVAFIYDANTKVVLQVVEAKDIGEE